MRSCGWWIGAMLGTVVPAVTSVAGAQSVPTPPAFTRFDPDVPVVVPRRIVQRRPELSTSSLTIAALLQEDASADGMSAGASAGVPTGLPTGVQSLMVLPPEPPTIYAPPEPERVEDGINKGGVNVDVNIRYLTDDNYRGVSHNRAVYSNVPGQPQVGKLHASNFQVDAKLEFNFGKLPHPFVGVFANVNDSDPLSRFQEIRPFFGFEYTLRPVIVTTGLNTYIYPERERIQPSPNTSEVFVQVTLDDSFFFLTPQAILSPYVYGAYDYDRNKGWYLETGIKHEFYFQDFGFTLTPYGDVAYISHFRQQFVVLSPARSGFQHYDLGLTATYSLNHLLHLSPRYGQFSLEGYLTYTGKFSNPIFADTEVWGGVGLKYRY